MIPTASQDPRGPQEEIQRLKAVIEELKLLNDIALESSRTGTLQAMLGTIIDKSLKVVNAEQGTVFLVTDDANTSLQTFIRQDNQSSLRHTYTVGTHVVGSVLYTREPLIIADLSADSRFEPSQQERADIRSILCVPIINQSSLIGVFMMVNKKGGIPFTEDDQRLLMILSAQAGQLIANARLQEDARRKKEELAVAQMEADKWRELDLLKSRFFADISHEFRTPLTLILEPIEQLIARTREGDPHADYHLIRRNAHRILRLINDILDLSRLEAKSMKLRLAEEDLVSILHPIVKSFSALAEQNQIDLRFSSASPEMPAFIDREKIETVCYNLLSNAFKFTRPHGTIRCQLASVTLESEREPWVWLTVADSGRGIPADKLEHVFDRYYQVTDADRQTGSGLGLALTRGLVELHHGTIAVTSTEHAGTSFEVRLPVGRRSFPAEDIAEPLTPGRREDFSSLDAGLDFGGAAAPDDRQTAASDLPLMLIVEDDPDMRRYLCDNLKNAFRVFEASDGEIGLSIARDIIPDIVVSDIGLPAMDGIQFCRTLKQDERTSHIPVLFLTARADQEMKLAGLETGADDYLTKPFHRDELELRVRNLVEGRRRLRERFGRTSALRPSDCSITSADKRFLEKVLGSIERSMGDETFSVENLARDVAMSYSQLHRKLTALLNQSPNHVIRSIRLQRAKDLIERDAGTISEIAYTVGFGSPAYLTKCFHEQFGIVPSQLKRRSGATSPDTSGSPGS